MHADRVIGAVVALLAATVLWTARAFPDVPGQKVGAGFLPMLVGAGLLLCGILLMLRRPAGAPAGAAKAPARYAPAGVVLASIVGYIALADRIGFLVVAPLMLVACCRAFGTGWRTALLCAAAGTLAVHLVFYKLLRVPLPWGVLRPFY